MGRWCASHSWVQRAAAFDAHEDRVPSEDLMMLFAGVYAAVDDPRVRKDAKNVVATAYGYGSRSLEPHPQVFWRTITSNINSLLRVELLLDDCNPNSDSGSSFGG